jgi:hypothetical protein
MAIDELKAILHQQIEQLDDPQDIQDLFLTVSEFVGQRTNGFVETPELLARLQQTLTTSQTGTLTSHNEVAQEAKQWITR